MLPELLEVVAGSGLDSGRGTSLLAGWGDPPEAYHEHTAKVVLHREPVDLSSS